MHKTALIFFFFLVTAAPIFSQAYDNNLVVYSNDQSPFTLYLNDEKVNAAPEVNVKAYHVGEGWQKLKVEFSGEKSKGTFSDSIRIRPIERNNNTEITYMIASRGGKYSLMFMSQSIFSGPAAPPVPESPKETVALIDNSIYGNLYRAVDNKPVFFNNYDVMSGSCKNDLNDKEIKYALQLIDKTNDFEDKYRYIEKIVMYNCYTTKQISQLLGVLEIEMDKLKLAQKAHDHLKDVDKAANLVSLFKYPTFKEQYQAYLAQVAVEQKQKNMNCSAGMPDAEFAALYERLKKTPNEFEKTKQAAKELNSRCYSAAQLIQVMNLFIHDRERLEYATAAKFVVADKENYPALGDAFLFSETKGEFLRSISETK